MKRAKGTFKNNVGPQVRRLRYARGWSQSAFAAKLQIIGMETDRAGVSKIEARLIHVDDRDLMYLAEALKTDIPALFPTRTPSTRLHDFLAKLETTRF